MTAAYQIMHDAAALTMRIQQRIVQEAPSLQEIADCLCGARDLRLRATQVALGLSQGNRRDFALSIRKSALECERKLGQKLGAVQPVFAPGSGRN